MSVNLRKFPVWCPQTNGVVKVQGIIRNVIYPTFLKILLVTSCPHVKCRERYKPNCIIHHNIQGNW